MKKKKYIVLVVKTLSCILNYNYFVAFVRYRIGEGRGKREGVWREGAGDWREGEGEGDWREGEWRERVWREGVWREEKIDQ